MGYSTERTNKTDSTLKERWNRRASMTKYARLSPEEVEASLKRKFGETEIYDFEEDTNDGTFKTDEYEYRWIIDEDTAYDMAVAYVRESLEDSPESFTASWLEGHIDEKAWLDDLRSDFDNMVSESPESYTTFIDDEEPANEDDGSYSDDQIERMQEGYADSIAHQGVLEYMKNDLGYDSETLATQMNPYINWNVAANDAVDNDGWAHYLSGYDGNYEVTDEGVVYFIENKNYSKSHELERKEKEEREREINEIKEEWKRHVSLKMAGEEVAVTDVPVPANDAYAQAEEFIAQKQYFEALNIILSNNLSSRFDIKDIASKLRMGYLFELVERYNLNIKDLLTTDDINKIIDRIKKSKTLFIELHEQGKDAFEMEEFKGVIQAAKLVDFDFLGYLKEQYPKEFFEYPSIQQVKTMEDVSKLRQKKVTDTNHREFAYQVIPMKDTAARTLSKGQYTFSFAINSTDDIFPEEIFQTLNKHHASGDKPVAFVFGTYTPGQVLYVDEMQSDIIQRAQMYLQSAEDAKAKFQGRINELEKEYEGKEMPDEIRERVQKDMKNLERISSWSTDFMPQYAQYRSKIQNYFSGWNIIAMNTVLNFARDNNIPTIYVASSDLLYKKWKSHQSGEFTIALYKRMYDDLVTSTYGAIREGDWYKIELKDVADKIAKKKNGLIKQAEYEELYRLYPPRFDNGVKNKLLEIPEIKQFVDKFITPADWENLIIGFWQYVPFYDDVKHAIYFPESFKNKIMQDEESTKPLIEEYADEMTKHWNEEAKYWAEQAKQWGGDIKVEPEDYADEYTNMLLDNKVGEYEIRMILHELTHYVDHIERGEQFVEDTSDYYENAEKTKFNMEKYKESPAEQKSFLAEIQYLKNIGKSDTDIIFKMIMQYGGTDDYWKLLVESDIKTAHDIDFKVVWKANTDAGQAIGNKQIVRKPTLEDFTKEILPRTRKCCYGDGTIEQQYQDMLKKEPNVAISFIDKGNGWQVIKIDDLENISGEIQNGIFNDWAMVVDDFESPEAKLMRQTSDSESKPNKDRWHKRSSLRKRADEYPESYSGMIGYINDNYGFLIGEFADKFMKLDFAVMWFDEIVYSISVDSQIRKNLVEDSDWLESRIGVECYEALANSWGYSGQIQEYEIAEILDDNYGIKFDIVNDEYVVTGGYKILGIYKENIEREINEIKEEWKRHGSYKSVA